MARSENDPLPKPDPMRRIRHVPDLEVHAGYTPAEALRLRWSYLDYEIGHAAREFRRWIDRRVKNAPVLCGIPPAT